MLADKRVAVLGCGGLGSNVAAMLVRAGVLSLALVDHDVVEADNLNRQLFFEDQVGVPKVEALSQTLRRIDSRVELHTYHDRIDTESILGFIDGADAIVEAVDGADTKALIVSACARQAPQVPLVCGSGIAGLGSANSIETFRLAEHVWVAGDLESDIREGHALASSRVMLVAAHQAQAVIRELIGLEGA